MARNDNIQGDGVTIISKGVTVEGKISSDCNVRIDGIVNGDIFAKGNITVGNGGIVNGELQASVISVGGKIVGTLKANEKLIMESKSSVKGDVSTKILIVEAGAKFDGSSSMSGSEVQLNTIKSERIA